MPQKALKSVAQLFMEGTPDVKGQLSHEGFCTMFNLKSDVYTQRLVRIFDLDDSGSVGLREFVYGLAKFDDRSFEARVAFAYRLFDLDGDGRLDRSELLMALSNAMRCDMSQYKTLKTTKTFNVRRAPRVYEADPDFACPGGEAALRREVEEIARRLGQDSMGYTEFQMLVSRFPRLFAPCKRLYDRLSDYAPRANRVIKSLGKAGIQELQESLGRFASAGFTGSGGGFDDRPSRPTYSRLMKAECSDEGLVAALASEQARKKRGGDAGSTEGREEDQDGPKDEQWKRGLLEDLRKVESRKDILQDGGSVFLSKGAGTSSSGGRLAQPDGSPRAGGPKCKVCLANDVEILTRPCGHIVLCTACASKLGDCPLCRSPIAERIRAYLS